FLNSPYPVEIEEKGAAWSELQDIFTSCNSWRRTGDASPGGVLERRRACNNRIGLSIRIHAGHRTVQCPRNRYGASPEVTTQRQNGCRPNLPLLVRYGAGESGAQVAPEGSTTVAEIPPAVEVRGTPPLRPPLGCRLATTPSQKMERGPLSFAVSEAPYSFDAPPPIPRPSPTHAPSNGLGFQGISNSSLGLRVGYPADGISEGTASTTPVVSTLTCKFDWTIPQFLSIMESKIVSLPFGTPEWRWQMVLYPRGSPGSDHSHLSCFLRPLRNPDEINAGDSWTRPILNFTIQVFKASMGSIADSFGAPADEHAASREVLIQDTSASSFSAFDSSYPGWGFTYLLDLAYIHEAISSSGSLTLAAMVSSDIQHEWTTYTIPWCIPDFDSQSTEIISPNFGPPGDQWCVVLSRKEAGISGHLQPVVSVEESSLNSNWSRSISSLSLKVRTSQQDSQFDPYSASPPKYSVTKTLSGGFTFGPSNISTGWPILLELEKIPLSIDGNGCMIIDAEVTWDPKRVESVVSQDVKEYILSQSRDVAQLRAELENATLRIDEEMQMAMALKREKGELEMKFASERKEMQERLQVELHKSEVLQRELQISRQIEERAGKVEVVLKDARATIAELCAGMRKGTAFTANGTLTPPSDEDALILRAKLYATEAELAKTKEDLRLHITSSTDATLLGTKPPNVTSRKMSVPFNSDDPEGADKLPIAQAILNLKNELQSARTSLNDASNRSSALASSSSYGSAEIECAALRADVAMAYAELEVARAALVDSVAAEDPAVINEMYLSALEEVRREVFEILSRFEILRSGLMFDGFSSSENPVMIAATSVTSPLDTDLKEILDTERAERVRLEAEIAALKAQQAGVASDGLRQRRGSINAADDAKRGSLGSIQLPTAFARGVDSTVEPWTPNEGVSRSGDDGGIDPEILTKILHKLDNLPTTSNFSLSTVLLMLFTIFLSYSILQVHCTKDPTTPFCKTIIPAFNSFAFPSAHRNASGAHTLEPFVTKGGVEKIPKPETTANEEIERVAATGLPNAEAEQAAAAASS
ncbi:hypothetical protein HDU67_007294, partial [Dinochytrium kinnereticum]